MDDSTNNVTIPVEIINDVLRNYESQRHSFKGLFSIAESYDLTNPNNKVPINIYNEMCAWIELKMGKFNLIKIGKVIGQSAYTTLLSEKIITVDATPLELTNGLGILVSKGIHDPKKRGWQILNHSEKSIFLRKTQTFNPIIQLGLLRGLIEKSNAERVRVAFCKEVINGDEFDEYIITWR